MSEKNTYRRLYPDLPEPEYEPLAFTSRPEDEMLQRAQDWYAECNRRRTTRHFSQRAVPKTLIELAIKTSNTAPSGAHQQPWHYVAINDQALKEKIRAACEEEEYRSYTERMTDAWRLALAKLGTDWIKEHITDAPWIIVLFKQRYQVNDKGEKIKNYYVEESVGISAGLFIAAVHHIGLTTLTHTPNPMNFLKELLNRPANETPVLLLPVGYPADDARVPKLSRKPLADIVQWNQG